MKRHRNALGYYSVILLAAALLFCNASRTIAAPYPAYSPLPLYIGSGPAETSNANTWYEPSDSAGAIGRNYIVQKVNAGYQIWNRNTGAYTTTQPIADSTLWSDPNFTPFGDAHVLYDPYGPGSGCTRGGGRWIFIELGYEKYSFGTDPGVYVGVTQTDDPTAPLSKSFVGGVTGGTLPTNADYPWVGFNTNWITVSIQNIVWPVDGTQIIVFPKYAAECNSDFSQWTAFYDPTLTSHSPITPVETYHSGGSDPYASTEYILDVVDHSSGTLGVSSITGTPTTPALAGC